jgi:hypothetical protein
MEQTWRNRIDHVIRGHATRPDLMVLKLLTRAPVHHRPGNLENHTGLIRNPFSTDTPKTRLEFIFDRWGAAAFLVWRLLPRLIYLSWGCWLIVVSRTLKGRRLSTIIGLICVDLVDVRLEKNVRHPNKSTCFSLKVDRKIPGTAYFLLEEGDEHVREKGMARRVGQDRISEMFGDRRGRVHI